MALRYWLMSAGCGLILATGAQGQTLETLYRSALQNDTQLSAALANARATGTQVTEGRSLLLPSLDLEASTGPEYSRTWEAFEDGVISPLGGAEERLGWNSGAALVLSQNIFNRQAVAGYDAVRTLASQSEAEVTAARSDLLARVVEAYLNVLKAREGVSLANQVIATVERQREQTQERYDVGLVAITDVLEATATLDQARADQLGAENQLTLAQQQLSRITGVAVSDLPRLREDFEPADVDTGELDQWLALSRQNPSVVAGRLGIEAARDERRANESDRFPVIQGQIRYGYDNRYGGDPGDDNFPVFSDETRLTIGVTASLNFPVYDGGSRRAGLDRSGYRIEAQQARLDGLVQQTELEVRQRFQQLRADLSRLNALQQVVSSRQSAAEATELGYDVGSRNIVEVLNAQQALLDAQNNQSNARHDFLSNYFRLQEAAGQLDEHDIVWLNAQLTR